MMTVRFILSSGIGLLIPGSRFVGMLTTKTQKADSSLGRIDGRKSVVTFSSVQTWD